MFGFKRKTITRDEQIEELNNKIQELQERLETSEITNRATLKRAISAEQTVKDLLVNLKTSLIAHDKNFDTMISHRINI